MGGYFIILWFLNFKVFVVENWRGLQKKIKDKFGLMRLYLPAKQHPGWMYDDCNIGDQSTFMFHIHSDREEETRSQYNMLEETSNLPL